MKTIGKKAQTTTFSKGRVPKKYTVKDLLKIMARLRSPSGCPWDREQSEQTLKKYLIEESYEALEAIEAGNPKELREELGDILLQIIFLSRIAEERGEFNFFHVVPPSVDLNKPLSGPFHAPFSHGPWRPAHISA